MGFGVWGLGFGVWGLGFGVCGSASVADDEDILKIVYTLNDEPK